MKIGKRLHELRKKKKTTLEELSSKTGVALATLSRMENDKMVGTIESHNSICKALGVSILELYHDLEADSKLVDSVASKKRVEHFSSADKTTFELLVTKAQNKKILPILIHIEKGGSTQTEQNDPGVEKFLYIMSGKLDVKLGNETYNLKNGDSLYFDASLPHSFSNASGNKTEAICVISPPEL